jgi:hypothetical protein
MKRLILALCLLLVLPSLARAEGGIILTNIAAAPDTIELLTSSTAATDYQCQFADHTTTTFVPGNQSGQTVTATTTTIVAAPAANEQRQVKMCTIWNRSTTAAQTITFKFDANATERFLYSATLSPGESALFSESRGFFARDANGREKLTSVQQAGISAQNLVYNKTSTTLDAAGYWMLHAKDAGQPGAWLPPAPGINGFDTLCSTASNNADPYGAVEIGSQVLANPAAGGWFLSQATVQSAAIGTFKLIDIVWVETALVVTTTTTQAVTSGALLARDDNGSTNGDGYRMALYALTALGNASAVSNTTFTYVDSDNNAANTGTMQAVVGMQAPATPVIGTFVPFSLAAGDRGIRSISEITLGTSYTSGTMALIIYRELATVPVTAVQVAGMMVPPTTVGIQPGVRVYNGSCLAWISTGPATTATTPVASYTLVNQ